MKVGGEQKSKVKNLRGNKLTSENAVQPESVSDAKYGLPVEDEYKSDSSDEEVISQNLFYTWEINEKIKTKLLLICACCLSNFKD